MKLYVNKAVFLLSASSICYWGWGIRCQRNNTVVVKGQVPRLSTKDHLVQTQPYSCEANIGANSLRSEVRH